MLLACPERAAAMLALLSLIALPAVIATPPAPEVLLVKLRPAGLKSVAQGDSVPPGTSLTHQLTEDGVYKVTVASGASVNAALKQLQSWPTVEWAEKDVNVTLTVAPNDPRFRNQVSYMRQIKALNAWAVTQGSKAVTVCTIDSGLDTSHPDLRDNIAADSGISVLGLPAESWPAMRGNSSWPAGMPKDVSDDLGHGTMIAGILGAVGNNSQGIAGVAWKVNIVACKAFNGLQAPLSTLLPCFDYCSKRKARIIVAPWGTNVQSFFLKQAVQRGIKKGALLVASAGNNALDNDQNPFYPGQYSRIYSAVVSVGSNNPQGYISGYSNYGRTTVDLFAPGDNIVSTAAASQGGGYTTASGTSVSVPIVAGAAALMASASGNRLRGSALKALLLSSVEQSPKLATLCSSKGVLNVARAVYKAKGICYPPDGNC